MIARLKFWAPFVVFGLAFALWVGFSLNSCAAQRRVAHDILQAEQDHNAAVANAAQGAVHDQESQAAQAQLKADAVTVAQLRAQLARLRAGHVPPTPAPGTPDPQPVAPLPDPVLDRTKDALIEALVTENGDLKTQVLNLTSSRDSWKAAYDASSQEAAVRRLALEAQMAAMKAERWKGRLEGFAVGIGTGYVAGRIL